MEFRIEEGILYPRLIVSVDNARIDSGLMDYPDLRNLIYKMGVAIDELKAYLPEEMEQDDE